MSSCLFSLHKRVVVLVESLSKCLFSPVQMKKITLHVLRDSYESHVFKVHFFANFFQFFKTFDLMCRHAFHNSGMSSQRVCRRPVSMPFKRDEKQVNYIFEKRLLLA